MDEQRLIEKNNRWIWKNVHAFSRKQTGYGSIRYDEDDLYQECVLYLLQRFRRSGKTVDEFMVSDFDLRHVMCEYIQSLLPVTTPKTVRNYSKMMTEHGAQKVEPTEVFPSDIDQTSADAEFAVDIHHLKERLDKRDQQVLKYILLGYGTTSIMLSRRMKMKNNNLGVNTRYRLCGRNGKQKMKKQRANLGFCSGDLWDMDSYLLELIPAMLREFAATTHTYPVMKELLNLPEGQMPTCDDYYNAYIAKINSIADQFEAVLSRVEDTNDIADEKYTKKTQTMLNKAFKELASVLFTLWD